MKIMTTATAALAITALSATAAFAGDMKSYDKASMTTASSQAQMNQGKMTKMVKTIDADGQVSTMTVSAMPQETRKTAVLGALAVQNTDAYVVEAPDGELFINHIVPLSELPDPTLNVNTQDTYTVEYRGMVFTNRVVAE